MTGILFDLDGVLYVGERAVPGAVEAIAWVREEAIPHVFVTNTTSRPRTAIVERLRRIGIHGVAPSDVLTPAVAARDWLADHVRHRPATLALFVPTATQAEFADADLWSALPGTPQAQPPTPSRVDAVVIGDLGTSWTFPLLNQAFALLMQRPQPALLALGMTRYWRAPDGLRLDTGPFVRALEYAAGVAAVVTGKPAPAFFLAAAEQLGLPPAELVMVGDDIRGDVGGAQAAGMRGLLVRTGKFTPGDLEQPGEVTPDFVLDSVADLPAWWSGTLEA